MPRSILPRPSKNVLRPLLLAAALSLGAFAMNAFAQNATQDSDVATTTSRDGTLLSVSAQAESKRVPDVATISAGVVTQAADANGAMRANAAQMDKVMAQIKAAGVAERDIQTSGVNLNPQYKYVENQNPTIIGYQASNNVNLKIRDIGKLGKVLDSLVASGANQINGPTFEIDQPEPAYDEARRAALDKAQARAQMYAKALGMQVRRIVSISEGGGFHPPVPMPMMMRRAGEGRSRYRHFAGRNDAQREPRRRLRAGALSAAIPLGPSQQIRRRPAIAGLLLPCAAVGRESRRGRPPPLSIRMSTVQIRTAAHGAADRPHPRRRRVRSRAARCFGLRHPTGRRSMVHAIHSSSRPAFRLHPDAKRVAGLAAAITLNLALLMLLLVPMQGPPALSLPETGPDFRWIVPKPKAPPPPPVHVPVTTHHVDAAPCQSRRLSP